MASSPGPVRFETVKTLRKMATISPVQTQSPSIDSLIDVISSSAHLLNLSSKDGKQNSAAPNANDTTADSDQAHDAGAAKTELLDACRQLITTVSGPTEVLKNMALIDKHNLVSLQIINHYEIAIIVPSKGAISIDDIASKCKLPVDILARILRQAMTYHVFCEPEPGYVAHTITSREIPRLAPLLTYQLEICLPSAISALDWLKTQQIDVPKEEKTKEGQMAPFQIAHDTKDSWWDYAEKRPQLNENYGRYQAIITKDGPHDVQHVVDGFAWNELGGALVIDVGGANGYVATNIAGAHPELSIVIQDNPGLKGDADALIPEDLKSRVVFAPHSFFNPQQVIGRYADVFLLRHILHDWNDESGIKILRNLTGCMKPDARIVVAEQVLDQPGTLDAGTERVMRALDMQMMVQFGGKERTLDDWEDLFKRADERLWIAGVKKPEGSADSFLELRLKEGNEA